MLARSRAFVNWTKTLEDLYSSDLSDEKYVALYEKQFEDRIKGLRCIATNQGRAAFFIALQVLNVLPGDEVIIPGFTYERLIDVIREFQAVPVLVDNSVEDLNAHVQNIEKKITKKTKAIVSTHLFGIPTDIQEISSVAKENNCYLIEDCAQCLGPTYQGKIAGSFGDMSFFSFNFEKHMSTGEGGMLVINNPDLLKRIDQVISTHRRMPLSSDKNYVYGLLVQHIATEKTLYQTSLSAYFGQDLCQKNHKLYQEIDALITDKKSFDELLTAVIPYLNYEIPVLVNKDRLREKGTFGKTIGWFSSGKKLLTDFITPPELFKIGNSPLLMNSIRAIVGTIGLQTIDEINTVRNKNAQNLIEILQSNNSFLLPSIDNRKDPVFLKLCILNKTSFGVSDISRKSYKQGLEINNMQWPLPIHQIKRFKNHLSFNNEDLKNSEYTATHILNIPVHWYVSEMDIQNIGDLLNKICCT